MTLTRVPMPSPNYSGRDPAGVRLIVVHTAEGARTIESLGNYFANPASEVSSHAGADDTPGTIGVYVERAAKAWTQGNANPVAVSLELCAFAAWDAAEWDRHPAMLENTAAWIAEEAAAFGVPLTALDAGAAQGGGRGVCQHIDLGSWGGGHVDCGPAFPLERVLQMAGGAPSPAPGPTPPPSSSSGPPWPGEYLANYTEGGGTATWQARMVERGWSLAVDDAYGDQSEAVCFAFQEEAAAEGYDPGGVDGIVGPKTWALAWTKPIT